MNRCLHRHRGVCPACRAFALSLRAAVETRETAWRPGIIADLSRSAEARKGRAVR